MRKITNDELGRKSIDEVKSAGKNSFIFLLDNVRSFNNTGSVFRTADAFLCKVIYLCGITPKPPHREIHKTALGAEESVDWKYFENGKDALIELKSQGCITVAIEQVEGSISLHNFNPLPDQTYVFIFGHEVNGVSEEVLNLCDMAIEIPQQGSKHSLNVSVCAGIIAWNFINKSGNKNKSRV